MTRILPCLALFLATISTVWTSSGLAFLRPAPETAPVPPARSTDNAQEAGAASVIRDVDWLDPGNPDRWLLQDPKEALAALPHDKWGSVSWMQALRQHLIDPRHNLLSGTFQAPSPPDVIMRNTKEMPYVRFPHASHNEWLACGNCHSRIFEPRAGANRITMADIFRGKACGVCHDKVAFVTFLSCERCHSVARK